MYKALIVDDEKVFRETLINRFNWEACNLAVSGEATNGVEALSMIKQMKPEIIICDVKMPFLNGLEVLKYLNYSENIKFIIVSGYNDFEFTRQAIKYGAFDYILKPIDEEELIGVLLRAVESLNRAHARQIEDISFKVKINKMLEKHESLLIHYAESRNISSIEKQIDDFFMLLDNSYPLEAFQSSYCEFILLANKICDIFKLDGKNILTKFEHYDFSFFTPSLKPEFIESVKEIFREVIDSLVCSKDNEGKKIVREVLDFIEDNYAKKISLEFISRRYHINPAYFSSLFKSVTQVNFSVYLTKKRLSKAMELLADSSFKIYQVAELVGYDDEKYFSQIFKKYTGKSPSEYLKKVDSPS